MKRGALIFTAIFAVTLAVVFGLRVSADAIAVIIGVLLGVLASVPTTVLLIYVLLRGRNNQALNTMPTHQPPVVIINAGDRPTSAAPPMLPPSVSAGAPRQWTVIGDEDTDD